MGAEDRSERQALVATVLVATVLEALDCDDSERGLLAAIEVLRCHGLAEPASERPAWLELQVHDQALELSTRAGVEAPDAATRALLRHALRASLRRVSEGQELRRVRERFEMFSAASFEGMVLHVDGVVVAANRRFCDMLGYTQEEVLSSEGMMRCVAPEDVEAVSARIRSRRVGDFSLTLVRKDGSRFRAECSTGQSLLGHEPVRVVAVRDLTVHDRTLRLLRESEARLRQILQITFDCVVLSRDGVILEATAGAERLFGCASDELVGRPVLDFVAASARPELAKRFEQLRVGAWESVALNAQGEPVPVAVVSVLSTLDGVPIRASGLRDLREARRLEVERRRLQMQVERSQRLESVGVLAGGIAHDFNNLLVGILGGAELLLERLSDPALRDTVEWIMLAGKRASGLTKQMLAYAGRRSVGAFGTVDLGALLRELHQLLDAALSKKAQVVWDLAQDCAVRGERATLSQVLMNLLTNASDALEGEPGTIRVSTRRVQHPGAHWDDALGATVGPGEWVLLEICDTGSGMNDATRGRIFEPFFTTKTRGHGLGLGACLSIVAAHQGAILVESAPGQGSKFSILLPAAIGGDERAEPRLPTYASPCRILIVDDEPLVRVHLRRLLELRGFAVEEACGGEMGLRAIFAQPPDVALLDLTMPDLDGIEVLRQLRAHGSQVPIILCSGNLHAFGDNVELNLAQAVLEKPFGIDELMDAIGRASAYGRAS